MTQGQQKQLIKELIDSIHGDMRDSIELGRVPAEWDGHELRQWLANKFNGATSSSMNKGNARRRNFDNEVIVRNL